MSLYDQIDELQRELNAKDAEIVNLRIRGIQPCSPEPKMQGNTWNQVLHGRGSARWDFLNPSPEAIDWHVIAMVLARIPRFGGHTRFGVYSDAQHLVEGARAILRDTGRRDWAAAYLLHDGHEYVIGDDVRPKIEALATLAYQAALKDSDHAHDARCAAKWLKAAFRELKNRADAVIYRAAGLKWPLSEECARVVKEYDNRMLRTEADARTGPRVAPWGDVVENAEPIAGVDTSVWGEDLARALFMAAARELLPVLGGGSAPVVPAPSECECCSNAPPLAPDVWQLRSESDSDMACFGRPYVWQLRSESDSDMDWFGWPDSPAPRSKPKEPVKDWCDWADGCRTPGICTTCGGSFGIFGRPSVCKRATP